MDLAGEMRRNRVIQATIETSWSAVECGSRNLGLRDKIVWEGPEMYGHVFEWSPSDAAST